MKRAKRLNWSVWRLAGAALLSFALLLLVIGDLSAESYWRVLAAAFLAAFVCGLAAEIFSRQSGSEESIAGLLSRIRAGDLTVQSVEIRRAAKSEEMISSIRALVLNLERTISRFSQLAADVGAVSEQVGKRSRSLAQSTQIQLTSTEATARSIHQIDQSINSVQKNMESLSTGAEETSTSILQMSASIEEVGRIAQTLSDFVDQTATAIEEMIASINEVAMNTESFSSFSVQTASSMVEMNATTQEIGRSARQSSDLAHSVTEAANEGREAVRGTVDGMRKIQEAVDDAKSALTILGERSQEIGEIVRVIDEIAGQTNLLALNAAIIAAQAGDRGKGFAVVADEIRDLSQRTSASTDEIRTLIQNVQRGVEHSVDQMVLSADRVSTGVELTHRAERVLDKILELTERSKASISEIAKATEEQTRGSETATKAIEEVTKMVQQTAAATQQQSQTSLKIGEQAAAVRDYMKHLNRAMDEQESGSRSISRAMENIMSAVSEVLESTSVLGSESSAIVKSMGAIEQGSRSSNFTVGDLNQMANTLSHESSLLTQELTRFQLPQPERGGRICTATVLPVPLTLDPIHCQFNALNVIQKPLHEGLVEFGEGAELMPALADRWEVLEHGTLYRFHLREGARFHNGRVVTAKDVHDTFLRLLSPELNSAGKWILRGVVGANDVIEGRSRSADGIRVVDERTLELRLDEPLAFFPLLLSMPECSVLALEEIRGGDAAQLRSVGAGPFAIDQVESDKFVRLRRHRGYHNPDRPNIEELEFRLDFKNSQEVAEAFLRGELDIAHGIPPAMVNRLRDDPQFGPYFLDMVQIHTSYLAYDSSRPPFDSLEVRQAMSHAIDRERINQKVFSGLGVVANSLLPPGLIGYDASLEGFQYDPERARALLRRAGYDNGFSIDYWGWDTDEFYHSGQVPMIIEDLAAIGVRVDVTMHTAQQVRDHRMKPGHNTIYAGNWYADFPDSDNFFFMFFHSQAEAVPGLYFRVGELDSIIEEARRTNDPERRLEIYRHLNELSVREAPMVYLFHDRFFLLYRPSVRGLRPYLVPPPVRYHDLWIEE